jgi:hypothetical protein
VGAAVQQCGPQAVRGSCPAGWPILAVRVDDLMEKEAVLATNPKAFRSGALITFEAHSHVEAERLVANDPFLQEGLSERHWLRGWVTD